MRDDLNYGPILITKGPHKGKIGYFDDTDIDGKLIVYPNIPIHCTDYYKVSKSAATSVIPTKRLADRWAEIDQRLYENCAMENLIPEEEIALLHERIFCSDMLTERHLNSMQKVREQDKTDIF